ncbi:MAG: DNA primase [Gammaproteobacteria bacterium]
MSIPSAFIDQVIDQSNIVDVIGKRLPLNKKGSNYWCKCPFHDDNNPSMAVNEDKQFFYCFVCQESGNVIHFLRKYDGMDFTDAIESLASLVGLQVPYERQQNSEVKESLSPIKEAMNHFVSNLFSPRGNQAREYLKNRSISEKTVRYFNIGYAIDAWDDLLKFLVKNNNSKVLEKTGLIVANQDKTYDRFRGRVMFPIRNIKGEVIAFGGRIIAQGEPKYLNSPETEVFHKSNELYGLFEAKESNKHIDSLVVVEGYMDVISLYEHGIKNAVATLGTAITHQHLTKLMRFANKIVFAFDGDEAGQKAAWKAMENSLPILRDDTEISFIFFEDGEDPDSFVLAKGRDAFSKIANEAIPLSEHFFEKVKSFNLERLEGRSKAIAFAKPLIDSINNEVIRSVYLNELSKICDVTLAQLPKSGDTQYKPQNRPSREIVVRQDIRQKSMTNIFSALINYPDLAKPEFFKQLAGNEKFSFLFEILALYQESPTIKPSRVIEGITSEKVRDLFSQATVNELRINKEDARKLIIDCVTVLAKNQKDREEILKQQYNSRSISAEGRRELQKIILTKSDLNKDDQEWLQKLSAKNK